MEKHVEASWKWGNDIGADTLFIVKGLERIYCVGDLGPENAP
jgi:hypothetical protein